MSHPRNPKLVELARALRKNMTKEERKLWYDFLRGYPARFRRQEIIGSYIADFFCDKARLVIELDGSQHYDEQIAYDETRTAYLQAQGMAVLRVSNLDVLKNFEGVCMEIDRQVKVRLPGAAGVFEETG